MPHGTVDNVAELFLCAEDIVSRFGQNLVKKSGGDTLGGRCAGAHVYVVG